jgi:hypothetical protein
MVIFAASTTPSSDRFRPSTLDRVFAFLADAPNRTIPRSQAFHSGTTRDLWSTTMPEKRTIEKARADRRAGRSPSTQAGEFVREEINFRHGRHGARSTRQAIAIGLSEARARR